MANSILGSFVLSFRKKGFIEKNSKIAHYMGEKKDAETG